MYDSDTNSYSNIDITTTGFTFTLNSTLVTIPGQHYTIWSQGNGSYLAATNSNSSGFVLVFTQPLTNGGGAVGFAPQFQTGPSTFIAAGEYIPTSQWAPGGAGPLVGRSITEGSVTGAALTPASVPVLSGTGHLVLGILLVSCAAARLRTGTRAES